MTILIADDDKSVIAALELLLKAEGLQSVACCTPAEALVQIQNNSFQLALIDLNYQEDTTSGNEGLALVSAISEVDRELPLIVMTGWGTVEVAVEAMKCGAVDFIEKPWDNNRLITTIRTHIRLVEVSKRENKLSAENQLLRRDGDIVSDLICESPAMQDLLALVNRVATADIPVLIMGENGTGKSLLANYIHSLSPRSGGPFISVNMGGISDTTFESEMFGHVQGAFTDAKNVRVGRVELADGGTLFMDEIANMPLAQQAKMLRVLEDQKYERLGSSQAIAVSIRFISATNADIDELVATHAFRPDLLFRLNGITLDLPPLRNRVEDIVPMANRFLKKSAAHYDSQVGSFSDQAIQQMLDYSWPGNVRELQHVVERSVLLCQHDEIKLNDLRPTPATSEQNRPETNELVDMTLQQAESRFIQQMLDNHRGNVTKTAEVLGISRSALYRRLSKEGR